MYQRKFFFLTLLLISALTVYRQQLIKTNFNYFKVFMNNNLAFPKNVVAQSENFPQDKELKLIVFNLKNNAIVNNRILTIKGITVPNADIFVNQNVLRANVNGDFSTTINLDEGQNNIVIVVNDDSGNYTEQEMTIFLETLAP